MSDPAPETLSRRERQIMDVIYRRRLKPPSPMSSPTFPTPRATPPFGPCCGVLEEKGHLPARRARAALRFPPDGPARAARQSALKQLVQTFFEGSTEQAMAALLDASDSRLSDKELERLAKLIRQARKEGVDMSTSTSLRFDQIASSRSGLIWKSTLLLAAAELAVRGLRRRSAAARHLVCCLALAGVLGLPFLSVGRARVGPARASPGGA